MLPPMPKDKADRDQKNDQADGVRVVEDLRHAADSRSEVSAIGSSGKD